jgi:hypothetical protein
MGECISGDAPITNTIHKLDVHTTPEGAIDLEEEQF